MLSLEHGTGNFILLSNTSNSLSPVLDEACQRRRGFFFLEGLHLLSSVGSKTGRKASRLVVKCSIPTAL